MADVTLNIRHNADQATSSVNSLSNAMGRMASQSKSAASAGTAAANGFNKIGHACLNVGKSASHGASGVSKFVSSLGRIAYYRAIRTAIKYVGQAFNEGLQAAYAFSKASQPADYAKLAGAMDSLKASAKTMSLQLGAAFGGLLTAITPVLIRIINLVTQAAEAITRFFAVLNGSGYYKKASEGFEEVGNSAGGAGKKIKGLLASWDELNVIGKESGGGGGGSFATDYSGAYVWKPAESEFTTALLEGNLSRVGEIIGEQLREWGTKIDEWFGKYFGNDYEYWQDGLQGLVDLVAGVLRGMGFETAAYNIELFAEKVKAALGLVSEYYNGFVEALESSRLYAIILGWKRGITEFDKEFKQWGLSIAQTIQDSWALRKLFGDQSETILNLSVAIDADNEKLNELGEKIEELVETGDKGINIEAHVDHEKVDQYKETLKTPFVTNVNAIVGDKVDPKDLFTHNSGVTSPSGNNLALGIPIRIKPVQDGTVDVNVGLKKDGWDTVTGWVESKYFGGSVWKAVELWRGNFTTAQKWVDDKYSGGSVWKAVELWRGNFTTAQKWVDEKYAGGSIWKAVELWRGNFSTVQKWIEDSYLGGKITKTVSVIASLTNAAALEKSIKDAISGITVKIKTTVNGKTSVFGQLKTSEYAQGGFPEAGELFIAREAGPELVGTMNGNAAVANNDQIVAGIQSGVAQANAEQNELLRQQNSILMQLLNKDLTISPSVALGQVVARSTALYGRA